MSQSERDTLATLPLLRDLTFREWHGFVDGLYCGARWGARPHEYDREATYWRGGYLLGTSSRYALVAVVYWLIRRDSDEKET